MTNTEILTKAIQKAIDGGWLPYFASFDTNMRKDNIVIRFPEGLALVNASVNFDYQMKGHIVGVSGYSLEPMSIIFSHDFAKALWGEDPKTETTYYLGTPKPNTLGLPHPESDTTTETYLWHNWQYHLQQMVIAEDPIKYLGENI